MGPCAALWGRTMPVPSWRGHPEPTPAWRPLPASRAPTQKRRQKKTLQPPGAVIRSAHEPLIHYEPRGRGLRQKYSASLISGGKKIRVGGGFCFLLSHIDTDTHRYKQDICTSRYPHRTLLPNPGSTSWYLKCGPGPSRPQAC